MSTGGSGGRSDRVVVPISAEITPQASRLINQLPQTIRSSAAGGLVLPGAGISPAEGAARAAAIRQSVPLSGMAAMAGTLSSGPAIFPRNIGTLPGAGAIYPLAPPAAARAFADPFTDPRFGQIVGGGGIGGGGSAVMNFRRRTAEAARRTELNDLAEMARLERSARPLTTGFLPPVEDQPFLAQMVREGSPFERGAKPTSPEMRRQESMRRASDLMLGGAVPTAIGLGGMAALGPALNIGFATMSGGVEGGVIAGLATTVGGVTRAFIGLTRALMRFQDTLTNMAEGAGFTTRGFREQRAMTEGAGIFFGGVTNLTRERSMERMNNIIEKNVDMLTEFSMALGTARDVLKESFIATLGDIAGMYPGGARGMIGSTVSGLGALSGLTLGALTPAGPGGGSLLGARLGMSFANQVGMQSDIAMAGMGPAFQEMLANMERQNFRASFQDPAQFWRRTQLQTLAPDDAKEQRKITIQRLTRLVDLAEEAKAREQARIDEINANNPNAQPIVLN